MGERPVRDFSIQVIQRLRESGFEALWAGGCVRDFLLGRTPKDYDVATNATPTQVLKLATRHGIHAIPIGVAFGVVALVDPNSHETVEVATFRQDASYRDGRHPDSVRFTTAEGDAQRRDFTINGLFRDPIAKRTLDYVGGVQDLESRLLRAIGDPVERFTEDKLRMLRAVRFATTLGFQIEPRTFAAICAMSPQIGEISQERIAAEMERILTDPRRNEGVVLLSQTGLGDAILPEFFHELPQNDARFSRVLLRFNRFAPRDFGGTLATLGYGYLSPKQMDTVGRRWKLPNVVRERAVWVLRQIETLDEIAAKYSTLQPVLDHPSASVLVSLRQSLGAAGERPTEIPPKITEMMAWPQERLHPKPLLTGNMLIAAGIQPGAVYRTVLNAAFAAQVDGEITTERESLQFALAYMAQWGENDAG